MIDTLDRDTLDLVIDDTQFPSLKAVISCEWPQERDLQLTLLPGAIVDFFGRSHDTLDQLVRIAQPEDFGQYILTPSTSDTLDYVISLLKEKKKISQVIFSGGDPEGQQNIVFDRLEPGDYKLEIIVDIVPNGKWDPGEYLAKRQSEVVYNVPLPSLRPNWKEEKDINMQELSLNQPSPQVDLEEEN